MTLTKERQYKSKDNKLFITILPAGSELSIPFHYGKVHFYQYMEVELLQEYIHKGLTYFINVLSNSSAKLAKFREFTEEIVLLINFLKDFYYLQKYNSTYAEYFFALERESVTAGSDEKAKVSRRKHLLHTVIMTVIPYLAKKIDAYFHNLKEKQQNQTKILNHFQLFFTQIYPYLYAIVNTVQVMMKLRFLMFQKVECYDIYYKLSGVKLNYMEEDQDAVHYPFMEMFKTPGLLSVLIGHKVLTWYFNQKKFKKDSERKINPENVCKSPLAWARQGLESEFNDKKSKFKKNTCLLCSNSIVNPTVVKQTGHVYCYECISEYVKENEKCPLTEIVLSIEDLQLIYSGN